MHQGNGAGLTPRVIGETGGASTVTLLATQVPAHNHTYNCGSGSKGETNVVAGQVNCDEQTGTQVHLRHRLGRQRDGAGGGSTTQRLQPHENMQPYQALTFIIALQGIFPARN